MVCIVRTVFSYETKAQDLTWQGIPNALCRMLEINFGIIAACAPMLRTFVNHVKQRYFTHSSESLPSSRTPASQLQWYKPPTETPWYKRIKRNFVPAPPQMDMSQPSASSSNKSIPSKLPIQDEAHNNNNERNFSRPMQRPSLPSRISSKGLSRKMMAKYHERPPNATWAKDDSLKRSESLDLPIQGARRSAWMEEDLEKNDSGTFRYDQGWT